MEIGLYTFGEVDPAPGGRGEKAARRLRGLVEEMEAADRAGLDVYGVGEHHRPDYAVSAPAVVLAAGAARTRRLRLSSAVNVLSSDDPVRVFQRFATLDALSDGRAEIMVGRGSFIESFPLFGYDLADYDDLFEEKLRLLLLLRKRERVSWRGRHRPALEEQAVYPRPLQQPLPLWVATGGSPPSVVRAASLGLPLALAIIGGHAARFAPILHLYRDAAARAGHEPRHLPVSINAHGFIAESRADAVKIAYEPFSATMNRIGAERGWPPMTRRHFEAEADLPGALFLGSPQDVIDKILYQHELFGHRRFLLQLSVGPVPHEHVLRAIHLLGTEVAPAVRDALGDGDPEDFEG